MMMVGVAALDGGLTGAGDNSGAPKPLRLTIAALLAPLISKCFFRLIY